MTVGGTEQKRDALRTAILDAAEAAVAGGGLGALAMRPLVERAGCSLGMLYKLFADGDEVALRVNARTLRAVGTAMRDAARDRPGRRKALRAMAFAYLDYAAAHRPRWDALFSHRMAGGAPVPGWYAAERDAVFGILLRHADPDFGPAEAADWAHTLFSAVHGVVLLGLAEKLGTLPAPALRARVRAVVDALAGLEIRAAG